MSIDKARLTVYFNLNNKNNNMKKYTFFWQGNNPFSNWYKSQFTINNIQYNCSEQYMMHQKALLFGDVNIAEQILKTDYPKTQKELGRLVNGFNKDVWDAKCMDIMLEGLEAKFLQNKDCFDALQKAKNTIIVEASPYDRIWGIGYAEYNALVNQNNWGENRLGVLLTKLAQKIC